MSALNKQVGPYLHADGMRRQLAFEGGRSFTVLVAGAYHAGIIGPEHNGIVVLDEDHGQVVLDRHVPESSGYHGPSRRQVAEFERICAMTDWKEFTDFVRSNARFRTASVPDIDEAKPFQPDEGAVVLKAAMAGKVPGLPGKSILPQAAVAAHEDPSVPYDFPSRTRLDIVAELAAHAVHREFHGRNHLAWNIKIYDADLSGRSEGYAPNEAYDKLWEAYVAANKDMVVQEACSDALRHYLDGEATSFLGDDAGDFEFQVTGRSGGWLELSKFDGRSLGFGSMGDRVETLLEMDEDALARLYVGVKTFDKNIEPERDFAYQVSFHRSTMEEDWSNPDVAEALAEELGVEEFVHPDRAAVRVA